MSDEKLPISPEDFNFLKCDTVLSLQILFPDQIHSYREKAELTLWVTYGKSVVEIQFIDIRDLRLPPIHGAFQLGEFALVSRDRDGLEGIKYQGFDDLTGFHVLAKEVHLSWVTHSASDAKP